MESGQRQRTREAVLALAYEQPDWLPVLRAACVVAEKSEPYGGRFAGSWVLQELARHVNGPVWRPGLRLLAGYALIEKSGPSTRGGSRAYYRMPQRSAIEEVLDEMQVPRMRPG
jgi:hypothetical protein